MGRTAPGRRLGQGRDLGTCCADPDCVRSSTLLCQALEGLHGGSSPAAPYETAGGAVTGPAPRWEAEGQNLRSGASWSPQQSFVTPTGRPGFFSQGWSLVPLPWRWGWARLHGSEAAWSPCVQCCDWGQGLPCCRRGGLPPPLLMNHQDPGLLQSGPSQPAGSQPPQWPRRLERTGLPLEQGERHSDGGRAVMERPNEAISRGPSGEPLLPPPPHVLSHDPERGLA